MPETREPYPPEFREQFVPPLVEAGYRSDVPDHLGFGRSDKPDDAFAIQTHLARLVALMDSLGVEDAAPVSSGRRVANATTAREACR